MKTRIYKLTLPILIICTIAINGCKEKLDINPNQKSLIPSTIDDMQAILDANMTNTCYPFGMEASSDNLYVTDARFNTLGTAQDIYIWNKDLYKGIADVQDWSFPYKCIFSCNVVLQVLQKKKENNVSEQARMVEGHARFIRATYNHFLALQFCKQYDPVNSNTDLGLPLKEDPNINDVPSRSTLKETYNFIIDDLKKAIDLLPRESAYKTRPTKAAALALLARVYLSMNDYENGYTASNSAIEIKSDLLDYNSLDSTAAFPVKLYNTEVLIDGTAIGTPIFADNNFYVDSVLYKSYQQNDLRRVCFFRQSGGRALFKGSYTGFTSMFSGITTSEAYLMRAESQARRGNKDLAIIDLNELLKNRYKKASFIPLSATSSDDALKLVLQERRKELVFRGLRWMDLKRLNKDDRFQISLKRQINGISYVLTPNDPRYVFPIPDSEIQYAGLTPNAR